MDVFDGKIAVVTGAGQGIGLGVAKALHERKAKVIAVDRNEATLKELQSKFPGIQTVHLDLADWDKTRETFESFGRVDLLVNNAAIGREKPFLDFTKSDIDALMDTNFLAVINTMQVVARGMKERGTGGAIVNVSSVLSGKLELSQKSVYGATKAAVERITKAAAHELGQYQIRVNSVHPSSTLTPYLMNELQTAQTADPVLARTALGRYSEVEDIVGPILFLLNSEEARMVHGVSLLVDGGLN